MLQYSGFTANLMNSNTFQLSVESMAIAYPARYDKDLVHLVSLWWGRRVANQINRLSAVFVRTVTEPGQYADGDGLYLLTANGGKRWIFLYLWNGKRREMGLGSAHDITLAKAREAAAAARSPSASSHDSVEVLKAGRQGS
ncbi:Arm DNA-binding domain-containing protein [Sphingomonas qilianensis]|uniref:Arm DNA-binding domain-containing protein n=2 Tax=Sphingomonas qilianensis TaxID=1736690 RepID=A0ABU9XQH8_9SPHN